MVPFAQAVVKRMKKVGLMPTRTSRHVLLFGVATPSRSTTLNWRFRTSERRSVQRRIKTCVIRYDNGAYTRMQFLRAASYSVGTHSALVHETNCDSDDDDDDKHE